ncbi:NitT/TauT family transport system permease protein [Bifidobacterium commune]|uniref:NitT/TauT family transport system permease protein n=1 Tax=Bifidobacterium commune TaxID=1505727 RepID=A0A1C4GZ58_9BIFI|nr:ABC transporter permease subunit [Bifidobacterium commune]MBB2955479.1 NitT/TauT family transport system permease protein [Bifidobacterium commune]SCC77937.1 NitT/TauT family transport system permease protein [Bifidobacterium commune]
MTNRFFNFNRAAPDARSDVSFTRRLVSDCVVTVGVLALFGLIAWILPAIDAPVGPEGIPSTVSTDPSNLPYYALRSVFRMAIALFISLIFTFVYGLAAARSRRLGKILIPLLDILQSVPILGFLSATVTIWLALFPGSMMGVEAASIFAIFTSQAWNMTFAFYRSLQSEPKELDEAVRNLRLSHWQRFWVLDVPNSMIPLLWNMMMSVGGGWFFLTASEMISVNNRTYALPGIGSYVEAAAAEQQPDKIGWAILTMVIVVVAIDILVWKPLTAWAEKFRITQSESTEPKRSAVLTLIRQSHIDDLLARILRPLGQFLDWITRPLGRTGSKWGAKPSRRRAGDIVFAAIIGILVIAGTAELMISIARTTGLAELGTAFGLGSITFLRVALLTALCSIVWVPVGAIIGMNPKVSRLIQPLVQVLASFPANFIFPFVVMVFVLWNISINWGSILLMALGTQWYILFNVIAGASAIPDDLVEMTRNFHITGWMKWKTLILPAVFGSWVTGGITAAGGAWNASIVSEIVSYGHHTLVAKGLGSYIAEATAHAEGMKTIIGVTVMAIFVVAVNYLFWNPLERLAARRFNIA